MVNFFQTQVSSKRIAWLRPLVADLSPQRPGFDASSVHAGFVINKVAVGQAFLRVLRFSLVNFIPPVLHENGKTENPPHYLHLRHRVAQDALRLQCVCNFCYGLLQ
jgi:hypothetical protein